jgi:hypothetical protein
MHPIERLRYVARAEGADPSTLVREAAGALAGFADDPDGLVTACRRLVDRHPAIGPMWWMAARVLAAADPVAEAWRAADELDEDPTAGMLAAALPDDASVVLVGWPEQIVSALHHRGDIEPLVVHAGGDGLSLVSRLRRGELDAVPVPDAGVGAAVAEADVVVLEASAAGPEGFVAQTGSRPAAAMAATVEVPLWVVAGAGRVLPARLWGALVSRLAETDLEPWDRPDEVVPWSGVVSVIGPVGAQSVDEAGRRADCPVSPELQRGLR